MKNISRFFLLIPIILILNLIWEFSHSSLYIDLSGISPIPHLFLASFTDILIILGIFLIVSLKNKNINWINTPTRKDYLIVVLLGLIISATIEIINLNLGRWKYTRLMPTIFGIGISPLIQLAATAILSLLIIKKIN